MDNKKYYLIFKIYLILALVNVFYSIYVRMTTGVDYNKLVNINQFNLSTLSILFGITSLLIIISNIIILFIAFKNKLPNYFRIYPIYYLGWTIVWFMLIPAFVCYQNIDNCLNSLNYLYNFEFIFNILEMILIVYSLFKVIGK